MNNKNNESIGTLIDINGSGKRFNSGKPRLDLIPPGPMLEVAKVFTIGAEKYGEFNWLQGMKWTTVLASLERHLNAFKRGEDFDEETGLYHMAHLVTNGLFILQYYNSFPQGDNRINKFINETQQNRIGLDIDDVLADFLGGFCEYYNLEEIPSHWHFYKNGVKYEDLESLPKEFWLNLKPKVDPKSIKFSPVAYITHRICPIEWTIEWLEKNQFPYAPVYYVNPNNTKVDIAKEIDLDVFVDDKYQTYVDMNKNGICCWLFDTPQNKKHNVGFKRIKNLDNLN